MTEACTPNSVGNELSARALGRSLRLGEALAGSPERPELEAFVREAFWRKHDASVATFMPTLLSFRDGTGDLRGVIGVRGAARTSAVSRAVPAATGRVAIAAAAGRPVQRGQVVEVGNLAGRNCRAAMRMVASLPTYLLSRDYQWIVFTATSAVRGILESFGAPLVELAARRRLARGGQRRPVGSLLRQRSARAGRLPAGEPLGAGVPQHRS